MIRFLRPCKALSQKAVQILEHCLNILLIKTDFSPLVSEGGGRFLRQSVKLHWLPAQRRIFVAGSCQAIHLPSSDQSLSKWCLCSHTPIKIYFFTIREVKNNAKDGDLNFTGQEEAN